MGLTVILLLVLVAFALTVVAATGRVPLWAAVFVLCVVALVQILPLGK